MEWILMTCFICDKHAGSSSQPPGGYIYEDAHWMVCHFPPEQAVLGQVLIESKRHFLDFADMTPEEAGSYGILVKKLYSSLKQFTGAERIYSLILLEGVSHFHVHLIPRRGAETLKGLNFLSQNWSCSLVDATHLANQLRVHLS